MAIESYTTQLERVQLAIAKIEGGAQSYTTASGRQLSRGDLAELYEREQWLRAQVARETGGSSGGIRVRGVTPV